MGTRYWVGGNGTWDGTAGTKWAASSGGSGGSNVPTSADDVFLDNGTGHGNVTLGANANCKTINCTAYTGVLAFSTFTLTVAGAVTFVSGQGTMTGSGDLICNTTATLTSGGKTLPGGLQLKGTSQTFTLGDNWTVAGLLTLSGTTAITVNNNGSAKTLTVAGGITVATTTSGTAVFSMTGGTWTGTTTLKNDLKFTSGTITLSGTCLYNTGTLTYVGGTLAGTSTPVLSCILATTFSGFSGSTAATGQMQWDLSLSGTSITYTLSTALQLTGTLTIGGTTATTFTGAFGITCGDCAINSATQTLTLSGTLTGTGTLIFNSTTPTFVGNFNIQFAAATFAGTSTITLAHDVTITGSTASSVTTVLNGAFNWNTAGLTGAAGLTGTATIVLTGGTWATTGTIQNSLTMAGDVTLSGTVIYRTGTLTYSSGTLAGASNPVLQFSGSTTISGFSGSTAATGQMQWDVVISGATFTLSNALDVNGKMILPNAAVTFAGAGGWTVVNLTNSSLSAARTVTLVHGNTYTVTGAWWSNPGSTTVGAPFHLSFVSDSAGNQAKLNLQAGADQIIGYIDATDIDSSGGQPIFSLKGTLSNATNWYSTLPLIHAQAQVHQAVSSW